MNIRYLMTTLSTTLAGCMGYATMAHAENWADRIQVSGFGSAVFQSTGEEASFNGESTEEGINKDGSFQDSKLGLNLTVPITDQLTVASQLFGTATEDYLVHIDWAFAKFQLTNEFDVKAGKIKYPMGLVNEYRDVGYAYPWLTTPYVIYSQVDTENTMNTTRTSPNITRESFNGFSGNWNKHAGNLTWGIGLFAGAVHLESFSIREMRGLTASLDWNDMVQFSASTYSGTMRNIPLYVIHEDGDIEANPMTAMNDKEHTTNMVGMKADWNNFILYAEAASSTMETVKAMSSNAWYVTAGYRFGNWLPHVTYQNFENDAAAGSGQDVEYNITNLGLRYDLMKNTALKLDIARIDNKRGAGLFDAVPTDSGDIVKYGIGVDYVF